MGDGEREYRTRMQKREVDTGIETIRDYLTTIAGWAQPGSAIDRYARAGIARVDQLEEELAAERKARPSLGDYTPEG